MDCSLVQKAEAHKQYIILRGLGQSLTLFNVLGVRCSSMVRTFVHGAVRPWFDPSVDPLSYFSFQPVLHDWCNKGCGVCYHVCGMMHIKEPLLLIGKCSPCGSSRFPLSLSEWSFTICLMPYINVNKMY